MSRSTSGRAGLWLVVALALGALAFLVLGDPLHLFGGAEDRYGGGEGAGEDLTAGSGRSAVEDPAAKGGGPELAGLYGAGDLGGVQLRLLDAATGKPRARQEVRLRSRGGSETALSSAADGVALFGKVNPGKGWQVFIEGSGFRAVSLVNITVKPGETNDLGDIMLGQNVVLRGRVLSPSGKPVPKASVAAYLPERATSSQGMVVYLVSQALAVPQPREEVITDEEGLFTFASLADGTYSLVARHPGYGTRQQNEVVVKTQSAASPLVVRLGEGARMIGKVLDADGRPIPGARLVALRDLGNRFSLSGTLERDEAVTDAKGQYVLDTLVDGSSYRFGVMADGFAAAWDQASTEVQRALERDFTLARGGFIEGRVTEEGSGAPVADAVVTVVVGRFAMGGMRQGRGATGGAGGASAAPSDPTTPAMGKTDTQGRFRLGPVLPGPVMSAVIKASGYSSASASTWTNNAWPDVTLEAPAQIEVSLKRGGSIEGRVTGADGTPIGGANVVAASSGNMASMWVGSPAAVTDAEGRYRVDGVPPGDYHLAADARGFAQADAGGDATKVTVPPEGGTRTLDLTLAAAAVIRGSVTDGKGEPVAGARVRTRPDLSAMFRGGGGPGGGARMVAAQQTAADLTDAQGRYRLEGVGTSVEWTVEVEAEEYVVTQSEKLKLKAGEVKDLDMVLTGGATLSGRVVGEGGAWVNGARIRVGTLNPDDVQRPYLSGWQVDRQLDARIFFSDPEGRFLIPNIRPGRVLVKVEQQGYVTYYKRGLSLAADAKLENHQILLARGEIVEGVVKGADGKPLSGALIVVTARAAAGGAEEAATAEPGDSVEPSMNAQTDADGKFRVENIPPGDWNVAVGFAPGHLGWFGGNDESAIKRSLRVPARDIEFRLKAQEPGTSGFGPGRPGGTGAPPPPRPAGGPGSGGRMPPPR